MIDIHFRDRLEHQNITLINIVYMAVKVIFIGVQSQDRTIESLKVEVFRHFLYYFWKSNKERVRKLFPCVACMTLVVLFSVLELLIM